MPLKSEICPHCGHPMVPPGVRGTLVGLQLALFDAVELAGTAGIDTHRLRNQLYAGAVDGGPESINIIAVMAAQINRKLQPWGLTIGARGGKGWRYRLRPIP